MPDAEYEKKYGKGPHLTVDSVVFCKGRILLIRRGDNTWALPGGFVDPGETLLAASLRELQEETSLNLEEYNYTILGGFTADEPDRDPRSHIITFVHVFTLLDEPALPKIEAGSDAKDAVWVDAQLLTSIIDNSSFYSDHQQLIARCRHFFEDKV